MNVTEGKLCRTLEAKSRLASYPPRTTQEKKKQHRKDTRKKGDSPKFSPPQMSMALSYFPRWLNQALLITNSPPAMMGVLQGWGGKRGHTLIQILLQYLLVQKKLLPSPLLPSSGHYPCIRIPNKDNMSQKASKPFFLLPWYFAVNHKLPGT